MRRRLFHTLRLELEEEGNVSFQEWSHDHEAAAGYGKIGFDDAERGRNDNGAGEVDGVEEAGNVVVSDCTDDTCPVIRRLDSWLLSARKRYAQALR